MPRGYLVTLGDPALDDGDVISGSSFNFTTAQVIGAGEWMWSGRDGGTNYFNTIEPGVYYLATNGNVYFVPDFGTVQRLDSAEVLSAPDFFTSDRIVTGTGGDDLIDASFVDADGDRVDGNTGTGADNDQDSVLAGAGNDTIIGGAGSDTLLGEAGADLIYGDFQGTNWVQASEMSWAEEGGGANLAGGFVQDTGYIDVGITFTNDGNNAPTFFATTADPQYRATGESFDTRSALEIFGNGDAATATTTITFTPSTGSSAADEVQNVTFRINDVDWASGGHRDVVTVNAYDADGNPVPVTLTPSGGDTVSGQTVTANNAADNPDSAGGSVLVSVAGPVASIEVIYSNAGVGTHAIYLTDLQFEAITLGGADSISGGTGDDTIFGGVGDDTVSGGDDNDLIHGEDGNDSLQGDAGNDTLLGGPGNDTLEGGTGADLLSGGDGDDSLVGGAGDDTLEGGAGADSLSGGAGMDFVSYAGSDAGVNVDIGLNIFSGGHATGDVNLGGIDGIIGSDFNDSLSGYDAQGIDWTNVFFGGAGDDTLDGRGGDDSLYGEDGDDSILGGAGNDFIDGGAGNDTLVGGTGADSILGGDGNDLIFAAKGDTINGGAGDDTITLVDLLEAGAGTITIEGGTTGQSGGDYLDLNGLADRTTLDITSNIGGELTGTIQMLDGTLVSFSNIDGVICFTPGTRILTAQGYRPIESLQPGDLLVTRDNGLQPLRWKGSRTVIGRGKTAPVRIAPHVFGGERALTVSPQHRMLFEGYRAELLFGESEVFVAATHLVDGRDVCQIETALVTYIHLMLDRHEVIYAEGMPTESFFVADQGLRTLHPATREDLFRFRPELRSNPGAFGDTARTCLRATEARTLIAVDTTWMAQAA